MNTWIKTKVKRGLMMMAMLSSMAATAIGAETAIQLGAPFADNAILQRDMKVPVWGWSAPGDTITVEFAGQTKSAKAGDDGKFIVWLDPLKASFEPQTMKITSSIGNHQSSIGNILVGEVWMASGQSNMQWSCTKSSCNKLTQMLKADSDANGLKINPIREFRVTSVTAQLHPIKKATGDWKDGGYLDYSAIAFAFAYKLYQQLDVPVGILNCSFSQTEIEAWVPREGWASADDDRSKAIHEKCLQTVPGTPAHKAAWDAFYQSLETQVAANEAAIEKGEKAKPVSEPVPGNMSGNRDASWLFCGRLSPVVPYAIRGAIWNQGYSNMGEGLRYYNNLHSLIRGWRIVWDNPELPVYFHQFYTPDATEEPGIGSTSEMRLGTWMARDIPNAGMASQIDISGGIHYYHKAVPGQRLALLALRNQYAKDVVAEGPMFKSYTVEGDRVLVSFDHAAGGLVVADTEFNRSRDEAATGFADPKVIANGESKVKLFWLAGEDRVWHPATFEIKGDTVVVSSKGVKEPRGISYGSGGIGFQPCLYSKALLPMTPFIQYDHKMVTSEWWPDEKLKIVGETIDPSTVGLLYEYRKLPLLSVQFRDNAVFQADKPVKIWGSTRNFGEWQDEDEAGDCKVHFEFGDIKKEIPVEAGMAEWSVTLPPMKADGTPHTLKASFTINGELAHERTVTNIVFGDVWYVAAPAIFDGPKNKNDKADDPFAFSDSGQIVRMIENQSKRGGNDSPSRFSVCVSRMPDNRFASFWKPAEGLAGMIGHRLASASKRPVGIIFMASKESGAKGDPEDRTEINRWMAPAFLKEAPSMMEDYKTVGSQYPDNPYYLENIRRYIKDWKRYWTDYMPAMIEAKAIPQGAEWGDNWGHYPSQTPEVGDSKATHIYNVYVYPFSPAAVKGILFFTSESMVERSNGRDFGPEMAALAKSFRVSMDAADAAFIYTVPSQQLAADISQPSGIANSQAVEIADWTDVDGAIEAALK